MLRTVLLGLSVVFSVDAVGEGPEGGSDMPDSCYPSVGCFSNNPPWMGPGRPAMPPQNPANISTNMYFFNNENKNGLQFAIYPAVNLTGVPFDKERPTFVIFECFMSNVSYAWVQSLKDVLLDHLDGNVFIASYSMPMGNYEQAVGDARVVGKMAAQVINATGADSSNVHVIGHCIGGQMASYAAKYMAEYGKKIGRLTALDPAGPLFEGEHADVRLSQEDADLVEVLHTDMSWPGMASPTGHVDFYFNGGSNQPGCEISQPMVLNTCSHGRAHDYFVEALQTGCMSGIPAELITDPTGTPVGVKMVKDTDTCQNTVCAPVGIGLETSSARGVFMVNTNAKSPYCLPEASPRKSP